METWLSFVILGEVLITLFILCGFMHEDKFILFEDKIIYNVKLRINAYRRYKNAMARQKLNSAVRFTPEVPQRASAQQNSRAA